jgi:hypothetical protein
MRALISPVFFDKNPLMGVEAQAWDGMKCSSAGFCDGRFVPFTVNMGRRRETSLSNRSRGTTLAGKARVRKYMEGNIW